MNRAEYNRIAKDLQSKLEIARGDIEWQVDDYASMQFAYGGTRFLQYCPDGFDNIFHIVAFTKSVDTSEGRLVGHMIYDGLFHAESIDISNIVSNLGV